MRQQNTFSVHWQPELDRVEIKNSHHRHWEMSEVVKKAREVENVKESTRPKVVLMHDNSKNIESLNQLYSNMGLEVVNFVHFDEALNYMLTHAVEALVLNCNDSNTKACEFIGVLDKMLPPIIEKIPLITCSGCKGKEVDCKKTCHFNHVVNYVKVPRLKGAV